MLTIFHFGGNLIPISEDENLCGNPLECGLVTAEEIALSEKTFQLYPNPAHHWVVINKSNLGEGDFQITVKYANGSAIKTKRMSTFWPCNLVLTCFYLALKLKLMFLMRD